MKKVVGVVLENNPKIYKFLTTETEYKKEVSVIVDTENGLQFGKVVTPVQEYKENEISSTMHSIVRIATKKDIAQYHSNQKESSEALEYASQVANELSLEMHFIDANYTFDRKQLFLSYLADSRVDFRQLAKRLAAKYKTRIELRQIGVRDKAKKVGGIGPCGLSLCCSQFLNDFVPVSINMAKNQDLALNPTKINGLCGRLLCCLNYEDEVYKELRQNLPNIGKTINTSEGPGKVIATNLLKQTFLVELSNKEVKEESVQ